MEQEDDLFTAGSLQHLGSKRSREAAAFDAEWGFDGGAHVPIRDAGICLPPSVSSFKESSAQAQVWLEGGWSNKRVCWEGLEHHGAYSGNALQATGVSCHPFYLRSPAEAIAFPQEK